MSAIIAATADDGIGIAGFGGAAPSTFTVLSPLNGFSDAVAIHGRRPRRTLINLSFGGGGGISTAESTR